MAASELVFLKERGGGGKRRRSSFFPYGRKEEEVEVEVEKREEKKRRCRAEELNESNPLFCFFFVSELSPFGLSFSLGIGFLGVPALAALRFTDSRTHASELD